MLHILHIHGLTVRCNALVNAGAGPHWPSERRLTSMQACPPDSCSSASGSEPQGGQGYLPRHAKGLLTSQLLVSCYFNMDTSFVYMHAHSQSFVVLGKIKPQPSLVKCSALGRDNVTLTHCVWKVEGRGMAMMKPGNGQCLLSACFCRGSIPLNWRVGKIAKTPVKDIPSCDSPASRLDQGSASDSRDKANAAKAHRQVCN